jgi:virginiamycin B lyase
MVLVDIAVGFDGNLWIVDPNVGILTVSLGGAVTPLDLHLAGSPYHLALGSDHNMWFTEWGDTIGIGRISQQGKLDEFAVAPGTQVPLYITPGPHEDLWFSQPDDHAGGTTAAIGRITITGEVAAVPVPSNPRGIVTGPDGNIWFTEPDVGKIGRFIPP